MNQAFLDILRGYSCAEYKGETIFFKHLTCLERCSIDEDGAKAFEKAKSFGNKTRAEMTEEVRKAGKWTDTDDRAINMQRAVIKSVEDGAEKLIDIHSLEANEDLLDEYREELYKLELKKRILTQGCAEDLADISKEIQSISISTFWDKDFARPVLCDDFESEELDEIREIWSKTFEKFANFEAICADSYCVNIFSVFYEHPHKFFDKSAFDITDLQARFVNTSKDILFILRECGKEIPYDDRSNYRRLVLYWKLHVNLMKADVATDSKEV